MLRNSIEVISNTFADIQDNLSDAVSADELYSTVNQFVN